ncbi:MAG TPA: Rho termination factor N-terminal domain-containing protein [Longimicrobiales bacterium]|nr:Rho termination factor N-terminal domain-containing protein [Longimicrobiales bacterium]
MPSWTSKDERRFEKIEQSQRKRGVPRERAREIAARTVNKQRRLEGRTPNTRTMGTGNPRRPLEARTVNELRNRAREMNIPGRSRMTKAELVRAIRERR